MKLWHLQANSGDPLWKPWYDKAFGFVVQANTEQEARKLAGADAGGEEAEAWLNPEHSSCEELVPTGSSGIIIKDFWSA